MNVDETDVRILEHLLKDGRSSLRRMAKALDLSPSTVSNRFNALREEGVIRGFKPVIDYEMLGMDLTAVLELDADTQMMEDVAARVREKERVMFFYEVTGETDMLLICKFASREQLNGFVKELQKEEGIIGTETKVVLTRPEEQGYERLQPLL
ncbi:MAG: Lrp/AsnC family transcriptional regulator [Candidatus Nanohaloarchaea archaeon]|nr:Lrp/AsnC family transcriptional regulator [Candidatus Nanohaloarchaea archaeon]